MQEVTYKRTLLPTLIALTLLVVFNAALYLRLSSNTVANTVPLPYVDDFTTSSVLEFPNFGGDWDIRDETLVQISTTGFDLGILIPTDIDSDLPYRYSVDMRYIGGSLGGGLIFNSQNGRNRQQSHMVRFNIEDDAVWIIFGYFGNDSNFTGQGSVPLNIAVDIPDWQSLGVLVNTDSYGVLYNGELIVEDVPLAYQGGAVGLITSSSQIAFDNLVVQSPADAIVTQASQAPLTPTPEPDITTTETSTTEIQTDTVFADAFDALGDEPSLWVPFSGEWEFVDGTFTQNQVDGFDFGAGYNQAFGDVTISTSFRHLEGQGGGIFFNMAVPDSQQNAHMVRYVHDDDFLFWGYFDETGTFTGQGSVAVPAPVTDSQTLTIINDGASYSVALNGVIIAPDIPIVITGDYVGLVTAQSRVAFDNFVIGTATTPIVDVSPESTDIANIQNLTLNSVSGDWEFGDAIVQRATEAVDYIAGTGIAAETFSVSVTINLPDDLDDAGAGLIFHMNGRDDISNGQMIRFGNNGSEIFWGTYRADGIFEGQGGAPVALDWSEAHRLTLNVRSDTYDVLIDDEILVTDLPVRGDFGWIGLVSYRGEVVFSNFALSIGQ